MRIHIVDNGARSLQNLFLALEGHQVSASRFENYDIDAPPSERTTDLVILSGGSQYPVKDNEIRFARELTLIRNSPIPILGICFGSELIAYAFGSKLEQLQSPVQGPLSLTLLEPSDPLFQQGAPLQVMESHEWAIQELDPCLVGLARSDHGIEIFRHETLPRYGFQFHPESRTQTGGGMPLLEQVLAVLKKK